MGVYISIHALLAESDYVFAAGNKAGAISIHALLAESDPAAAQIVAEDLDFYPRSPCGERLFYISLGLFDRFISIHALLAESDTNHDQGANSRKISIHALLAESDNGNPDTWL